MPYGTNQEYHKKLYEDNYAGDIINIANAILFASSQVESPEIKIMAIMGVRLLLFQHLTLGVETEASFHKIANKSTHELLELVQEGNK